MGPLNLSLFLCFSCISLCYTSLGQQTTHNSFLISSFSYPQTKLKPFDWRYMRVELPPRFSSMTMTLRSNVDVGKRSIEKLSRSTFPLICFREGGPPLPDVSDTYLRDLVVTHMFNGSTQGVEQCLFFQQNITFTLTNEQISSGVWYFGFFNGLGPARTQSKMITRGSSYTFSTDVSVEGCVIPTMWGPYCNYTIDSLSCTQSGAYTYSRSLIGRKMYEDGRNPNHPVVNYSLLDSEEKESVSNSSMVVPEENVVICKNSLDAACLRDGESKVYSLDIVDPTLQLKIMATSVRSNQTLPKNDTDGVLIMCYARYNAMPLRVVYDYSGDISRGPLLLNLPKIGQWYISIYVLNQTKIQGEIREESITGKFCFSLEWQMHDCPNGKAGLNCTWDSHLLQRVLRKSSSLPFESYYLPIEEKMLIKSANFPVEAILSNSTFNDKLDGVWTYFLLEVPRGAAGASLHFQITWDAKVSYGIYARFGGLPSLDTWDYYVNRTHSSNGSMFLDFSDSSEGKINFYVIYAKEGMWNFGLRDPIASSSKDQIVMSITLEGCPRRCSSHGTCHSAADESGLTLYSFCACDRNHGGFDCSIELVTHQGHIWQSIALIASNAAAILPAFWSLRQKAFSEWVLFTSSGISSGLYHACDVGTWCALSFHVLQFMDFWLSFMAVVSTFVYMTTIDEVSKRAIQTTVSILTALMAATGATRSANITLVVVIGILGLLIGWLFEFSSTIRSIYSSYRYICQPDIWQILKGWLFNLLKTLKKRFCWYFMFLGFVALSAAGISWKLETSKSYWIWHSIWHVTIYTSSFFFLCSISVNNNDGEHQPSQYELTRQNSSSRGDLEATGLNSSSRADLATNGNSS